MNEPVIKPVLWRCACDRRPCLGLQMCRETPPTPLYGPDDLVRAVAFSISETSSMSPQSVQLEAEETVDRLTKGET